jgi:hypothetical protein
MSKADLPWAQPRRPTTDDRHLGCAVVWRSHRWTPRQSAPRQSESRSRMDPAHFERLLVREVWQKTAQPVRQHRLSRTRLPYEQKVMTAGCRDLERPPGDQLAPHICKVRSAALFADVGFALLDPRPWAIAPQRCDQLNKGARTVDRAIVDECSLACTVECNDHATIPRSTYRRDAWNHSGNGPHTSVKSQLPNERSPFYCLRGQLSTRDEQAQSNRQVETRATLSHPRRSQVYRDASQWPGKSARQQSGPDAIARLADCGVRKSDHCESGEAI